MDDVKERLYGSIIINQDSGCWEFQRSLNRAGYGCIKYKGKRYGAHRLSWILTNGEIESNKIFVCHKCDNPKCINPDHLFLGTNKDNMQDCLKKGRMVIHLNKKDQYKEGNIPLNRVYSKELINEVLKYIEEHPDSTIISVCKIFNVKYQCIRDARRKIKRSYFN